MGWFYGWLAPATVLLLFPVFFCKIRYGIVRRITSLSSPYLSPEGCLCVSLALALRNESCDSRLS